MYEVGEVWKVNGGVSQKFESDKDNRRTRKTVRRAGREGESRPGQGRAGQRTFGLAFGRRLGGTGLGHWAGLLGSECFVSGRRGREIMGRPRETPRTLTSCRGTGSSDKTDCAKAVLVW